ncbi:MAG: hypothetical protein EOP56_00700 [Sphingobacteriales bacterium]|nr:MAG: hypothetical protein EOP56_00700 [Sphingobacteriales bacterium]
MTNLTNINFLRLYVTLGLLCVLIWGCEGVGVGSKKQVHHTSPPGYNLQTPYIIKLPIELDEISGVVFYPKDTSIFAINDERGWLYKIFPNNPRNIEKWKFFDGADFEDVVKLDSNFYVLESSGNIIAFRHYTADSVVARENLFPQGSGNEFEILYYDPTISKMVLICKDCESDKKKALSTYTFDPATGQYANGDFSIDVKQIAEMMGQKSLKMKPSAAAIHPITGELYVVSAVNDLFLVLDRNGRAKSIHPLDSKIFKQPEGIAFTPSGDMIISNEAAEIGVANILIYKYNNK